MNKLLFQKKSPYIIACIFWMIVCYLPFFIIEDEVIIKLAWEDSFYENASFLFLLLSSLSFFYLSGRDKHLSGKTHWNIFFLLLGIIFFFGAGEEISWGQRIFHLQTPSILSNNTQHEFNLHNMPLFDVKTVEHGMKTGIAKKLTIHHLYSIFWFTFGMIMPLLYLTNKRVRQWANRIRLPIPPIWLGIFFTFSHVFYWYVMPTIIDFNPLKWPFVEIPEDAPAFFFFIIAIWFINHAHRE